MSIMACSYCGDFTDTDNGEGHWDVKNIKTRKIYDLVCGCCCEKYLTESGELNPDLPEESQ